LQSGVKGIANWWQEVNASPAWQENIFLGLAIAYAVIGLVALIQLIRIELRVPEYGWTTQKVFHLLNFIVNGGELQWPLFCRHSSLLHACSKIGFSLMFFRLLAWRSASCRLFTAE
jgi:hypothetical protein